MISNFLGDVGLNAKVGGYPNTSLVSQREKGRTS